MISVIIPVYNAEKYIIACLNSIKMQNVDLEVICVDDGSTDNSGKVIKEYCTSNHFVKYLYQQNAGAPAARNNGLEHAAGEYVIFFDADDLLFPNALKNMLHSMTINSADVVMGNYDEIDEQRHFLRKMNQRDCVVGLDKNWQFVLCAPLPGNKLFKKTFLNSHGIKFEPLKIGQDLNLYLKILAIAKIVLLDQEVMGYRIVQGSISRQYSLKILDICNSIDNVKEYYATLGKTNDYKKYISIAELIAYRSQLAKIRFFTSEDQKNKIIEVLGRRIRKSYLPSKVLLKTYLKERIKCSIILCMTFFNLY